MEPRTAADSELIDYELPEELVAQEPAARRDASRLLVLHPSGRLEHRRFADLAEHLGEGDVLVVNDSRVIPARLRARRASGGAVEILLLEAQDETWSALLRPGKAGRTGSVLPLERSDVAARVEGRRGEVFFLRFLDAEKTLGPDEVNALCDGVGETPLPPYIHRRADDSRGAADRDRYQTVYAARPGAVAAPTAGLHFTKELLRTIAERGVERLSVTLHVGLDTFKPMTEEILRSGELHGERVEIRPDVGERLLAARAEGRRIVAVGTTTVRALESFAAEPGRRSYRERTTLFIRPGHRFRMVDALLTNFHLPRSSLLLLVSAFASRERILRAYEEAVQNRYRFYSYGDAMLIL